MKFSLVKRLMDPILHEPLLLQSTVVDHEDIIAGTLQSNDNTLYAIRNGIPRFVLTQDKDQIQTSTTFGFKWKKRDTYDSLPEKESMLHWCLEKYGFTSLESWAGYYASREVVLDVGCGSGFTSSVWLDTPYWDGRAMWIGVDISDAIDVAQERLLHIPNTHFVQADVLQLPFSDNSINAIFSEGVLHHTPSTRAAILSAARVLASGGEFHFYVYRRKGPVREYTDDYIRQQIAHLSDEEAWDWMRSLTELGKVLTEVNAKVELKQDIPLLGIKAGVHDVQRLIYWHFAKLYWNPNFSFEENVHVNFDWYRPKYAHRQSADEVRQWCAEAQLKISWFHEQESGFTVRAIKE